MSRNHIVLTLLCLVVATIVLPSSSQATPPAMPETSEFGVNSHIASRYNNYDVMEWPVDVIASSGAGWVREDFHWFWIEPVQGQYQWDYFDRMVDLHLSRGTNIIGVLGHPPGWATPEPGDHPTEPSFYAPDGKWFGEFAAKVAERYRHRVVHWEVWNEPDNPNFWKPHPDPVTYARVLSSVAMHVDGAAPEANILIGGLNPFDTTFMRTIAEMGAWWAFDIMNIHPYVDPEIPEANGGIGAAAVANVRSVMDWAGEKPIWVTEYGWSSIASERDPHGTTNEEEQANYLVRAAVLMRAAGVQRVLWYSMKDEAHNGYGMLRFHNGYDDYSQPRPSFIAFSTLNRQLAGAWFERELHEIYVLEEKSVYALRFVQGDETVDVIWALEPSKVFLPTVHPEARVINRDGAGWRVQAEHGALTLYPDQFPIYVRQPR